MDPKAADLFSHIIIAQTSWLNRIRKQQKPFESPWIKLTPEQCLEYSQKFYGEMKIYLGNINAEEFSKQIEYKNVNGDSFKNILSDVIAHVFNHASYHRGQIAQLVKKSNGKPAETDFIAFARI